MSQLNQTKPNTPYEQFQNDAAPDYTQHQMNYMQPGMPQQVVVQPNTHVQTFHVESVGVKWSWCHLVTAIISIWCCTIFGVIATVMSILSYVDHKSKDYERSRNKKSVAYGFGIAGIVIGSIAIVGLIIFAIVAAATVGEELNNNLNSNSFGNNAYEG